MSSRRVSSEATSPEASLNVSVTSACTTVPDGNGVGDWTASDPLAVPPVGRQAQRGEKRPGVGRRAVPDQVQRGGRQPGGRRREGRGGSLAEVEGGQGRPAHRQQPRKTLGGQGREPIRPRRAGEREGARGERLP